MPPPIKARIKLLLEIRAPTPTTQILSQKIKLNELCSRIDLSKIKNKD
jgi:hypothetical protein